MTPTAAQTRMRGLTLVELLLVLLILAVLATVALQSTDRLVDQSRFEATRTTLGNVEEAVIGPAGQRDTDGSPLVTGFVADVGRLPEAVGVQPQTQAKELWVNDAEVALPGFAIATPAGDAEVRVGGGWRGPYLRLPVGAEGLRDGWGNDLDLRDRDEMAVAEGDAIAIVRSLGADGLPDVVSDPPDYERDAEVVFERTGAEPVAARHLGMVTGNVYFQTTGTNPNAPGSLVVVRLYGPVDGQVGTIAQFTAEPNGDVITYRFDTDGDGTEDAVSIGPRVLRAYLLNTTTAPMPEDRLDDAATLTTSSGINRVVVRTGGILRDLVLR